MKKIIGILICMAFLFGCAAAEQEVVLPGGIYAIDVPDWMDYSDPIDGNSGVEAYVTMDLEMDYFSYRKADAIQLGMAATLRETAEERAAGGADVELRKVNGIEMLCFRISDEADGAPCIGYVFEDRDMLIEIDFWYATQKAADETKAIMETIRKTE